MWNKDELSPDELDRLMQDAADDADAERAYQEMMDQEAWWAEQAAADADADAAYEDLDEREAVDTDLF
jgi:hypothetical protein